MSASAMIVAAAVAYLTGYFAIRWERARATPARTAANTCSPGPSRTPPPPLLSPAEQAMLACLATRYAHADPGAGRQLSDYLRTRCPGISDVEIMRCVVALSHVARYFHRHCDGTDAFASLLHAMAGAALDLSALERSEAPRA
jgi:hypothetical protein